MFKSQKNEGILMIYIKKMSESRKTGLSIGIGRFFH